MAPESREGYNVLAQAFAYPSPGLPALLAQGLAEAGEGPAGDHYRAFVEATNKLPLPDWEELYTRTLDLDPIVAPYIGYHVFGESYRRGPFLSAMNRALREAGVDTEGELPDHIAPMLRYLAVTPAPDPALVDVLCPAVERMISTLRNAKPDNPYVHLFQAVQVLFAAVAKDAARQAEEAA